MIKYEQRGEGELTLATLLAELAELSRLSAATGVRPKQVELEVTTTDPDDPRNAGHVSWQVVARWPSRPGENGP